MPLNWNFPAIIGPKTGSRSIRRGSESPARGRFEAVHLQEVGEGVERVVTQMLEAAMMDRRCGDQASLFYQFCLDDRVPKEPPVIRRRGYESDNLQEFSYGPSKTLSLDGFNEDVFDPLVHS